jgi:hypothetical protein
MAAVLDVIAAGRLPVERLTTHRLPVERAAEAYDSITARKEPFLGVLLEYASKWDGRGVAWALHGKGHECRAQWPQDGLCL